MLKTDRFLRKYLEDMWEIYTFVPVKLSHQLKINCNNERNYQGNDLLPSEFSLCSWLARSLTYCYN